MEDTEFFKTCELFGIAGQHPSPSNFDANAPELPGSIYRCIVKAITEELCHTDPEQVLFSTDEYYWSWCAAVRHRALRILRRKKRTDKQRKKKQTGLGSIATHPGSESRNEWKGIFIDPID